MNTGAITYEDFLDAAKEFVRISNRIYDGWSFVDNEEYEGYLRKESIFQYENDNFSNLLKVEYVIFYNLSYGVPSFSFNLWNSSGTLLSLEDVRKMSLFKISQKEFYSVITQQEHPILMRPYFIVHPCHTESLLAMFRNHSRNIIVTFLGLITPLIRLKLPIEYGMWYK